MASVTIAGGGARRRYIAEQVVKEIVTQIQRADDGGDCAARNELYDQLVPFVDEPELASRVRYWRGFAKWRRAINGFGETPTPKDLSDDLTDVESEFDAVIQRDPAFVDAKVGAVSCMFNPVFLEGVLKRERPSTVEGNRTPASTSLKEAKTTAPDNPRLLWVVGPISGALLRSGAAARRKPLRPMRKVWMPSGNTKRAPMIR